MRIGMAIRLSLIGSMAVCGVMMTSGAAEAARVSSRGIPSSYKATLQHTAKTQGTVQTANRDRWRCSGTRCDGVVVRQFGVPACQALAHTQGPVVSFTGYNGGTRRSLRLNAVQLRQCNGGSQLTPTVAVHVGRPNIRGRAVPDTVRTGQLVLIGKGASTRPAPDSVRTGQLVLIGKGASTRPAPDSVRTGQLVLIGKGASTRPAPDTVRTGQLVLIGKGASTRPAPDSVRTGQLVLIGKGASARPAPDTVRTGQLVLIGKGR